MICSVNGDYHKYFVHKTAVEFVPQDPERTGQTDVTTTLYERVEYAYVGCNCGSTVKTEVKEFEYGSKK